MSTSGQGMTKAISYRGMEAEVPLLNRMVYDGGDTRSSDRVCHDESIIGGKWDPGAFIMATMNEEKE
jgi:hypothetical protein